VDPWDGRTLEWSVPSPPPAFNFVTVPMVTARDAFWVRKYGGVSQGHPSRRQVISVPSSDRRRRHAYWVRWGLEYKRRLFDHERALARQSLMGEGGAYT